MDEIPPDLYAEPRIRPPRSRYAWLRNQCQFFHEYHRTDRWDLTDPLDAFQLYYAIDILGFRSYELALLLARDRQYAKSHYYYGAYDTARLTANLLFPYKESPDAFDLNGRFRQVVRQIQELEEKRELNRQ